MGMDECVDFYECSLFCRRRLIPRIQLTIRRNILILTQTLIRLLILNRPGKGRRSVVGELGPDRCRMALFAPHCRRHQCHCSHRHHHQCSLYLKCLTVHYPQCLIISPTMGVTGKVCQWEVSCLHRIRWVISPHRGIHLGGETLEVIIMVGMHPEVPMWETYVYRIS